MKPAALADVQELTKKIEAVSDQIKYMVINEKTIRRYLRAFRSVDAAYEAGVNFTHIYSFIHVIS